MLVTTTKKVTTVEEVPVNVEIQTPFFSKRNVFYSPEYYAIHDSDKGPAVALVFLGENYKSFDVRNEGAHGFGDAIARALEAEPITEREFFEAYNQIIPASSLIEQSNDNYERSTI